ncbi:DNA polymerase I [bacterium]|nr:DNA polymerase I [bacterium]MBT3850209.1 DNA polymerase I [bacterium]|tara:strand:+ start:192 stop:2855 length:2664 start_codon:yes stop_codon:yes gene_type:complete
MASKRLFLLDASSYVFRAYHAVSFLTNSKSFPTNAIFGFVNMINKLLKDFKPEYLVAVLDSGSKSFRNDIYKEYKANRGETPEDIALQFPKIIEFLNAKGIRTISMEDYEADDLIGSIAEKYKKKFEICIISGDKDFTQLIGKNVKMIDTMKNKTTSVDEVIEKYGCKPEQMIDFLALVGDSVDNIPGVRGVGPKTAKELLTEFETLDSIYKNLDKISKDRIKNLLIENQDNANLSKLLVTIKKDLPLTDNPEDFSLKEPSVSKLNKLFKELEFDSFVKDEDRTFTNKNSNYKTILKKNDFKNLVSRLEEQNYLSLDLETTSPNPMEAEIVGISFSFKEETGFYIPLRHDVDSNQLDFDYVIESLRTILEDSKINKIGQNLKYEIIIFSRLGIKLSGIYFDTMIAAHCLDSSLQSYSLDNLSRRFLNYKMISYKDVTTLDKKSIPFSSVPLKEATNYSCEDSDITFRLYKYLSEKLINHDLSENFFKYEIPFIQVLSNIEKEGVNINTKVLENLSKEFEELIAKIKSKAFSLVGKEFNINSPLQLREILFNDLGIKPNKKTKKGEFSTDSQSLNEIIEQHEVIEEVLLYRFYSKLQSTYVESLPQLINTSTKRIHTSYNHVGTSTGRLSSSNPNLQNIPIKSAEGKRIREAFVPLKKGSVILSADYSQIELRLLAHFSRDPVMESSFKLDDDIHSLTAAEIFNVTKKKVTEDQRRLAKTINFGILYGIGPKRLSKQINQDLKIAKAFIAKYFEKYSHVKNYFDEIIESTRDKGYSETILERRRYLPDINSNNFISRGAAERAAINSPIQGSAADIIKLAMILINNDSSLYNDCRMIMQVHDELVFEVSENKIDNVSKKIKNYMEGCIALNVPLKVELGFGKSWSDSH